jgi:hypothetical protein
LPSAQGEFASADALGQAIGDRGDPILAVIGDQFAK